MLTSQRFQSLYEAGKIDNSLTLQSQVMGIISFRYFDNDTENRCPYFINLGQAIKQFESDPDVNQNMDTIKSECLVISKCSKFAWV